MSPKEDIIFMKRAIALAKTRKGLTHPNPTVGCVIVKGGKIVGEGVHLKAGQPHAEVVALKKAGSRAKGSTVYVTLEPCAHYGRTPPCSLELIKAGVKRVVVATLDPNPKVAGKGIENLRRAGIDVTVGVCEEDAKKLNEDFFHWVTTQTPFVVLKIAQTLDGFIATEDGESKWITSQDSRKTVHRLRCESSSILVGVGTVLKDNPQLTVRLVSCEKKPLRVVLDSYLKIPESAKILDNSAPTLIFTSKGDPQKIRRLEERGFEVVKIPAEGGLLDLKEVLKVLGKREVVQLLVEGGAKIFGQFFRQKLWNKLVVYTAPKVFGSGKPPFEGFKLTDPQGGEVLRLENLKRIGSDIYAEYYPLR
ncbi:MAG TPA: bifunctional diaminohydroxyphosphoribosylaminopyrimidine deaminase/5-amino-6-(5-phosphoribosylamino)uracil reductase RibD [Aquifex aeolicus]|nr:bifunctional diaminohydroxyphosphoribosylaminopyrimidine deaminase/5-amino-6-(5-phosphoribosylamino)uracil reductase RibD [Aquificales bacterium]HIQ26718.1 bifunctional diaminohydroxyphosphoribosylaminopyrimidine deaminase/5-amino-6-(5-phosphoribosylamino)uracil reductase RibD [Aquifex aeolicus]